ncbi:MAG: GTPase ObgE [Patescibacteria group bacterium]|nr:GTPase ObgE [Patescibacteria group bacterium]
MIDLVRIKVVAGSGGDGAISFYKLKNMRYGKPDGGDGGNGGSVLLEASDEVFDLENFRGRNLLKAEEGKNGGENNKTGESGKDLVLKVPAGTVVKFKILPLSQNRFATGFNKLNFSGNLREFPTVSSRFPLQSLATKTKLPAQNFAQDGQDFNQEKNKDEIVFDLKEKGQKILVAQGGRGGRGNSHAKFKTDRKRKQPDHWNPFNRAEKGQKGEEKEVVLELKYLAQIGLVGLPNAGKSSLLAVLTNAHPKIADYPFTTLEPNIGILNPGVSRESHPRGVNVDRIVLADIPGLIEGASKGKGLGFNFLRHIERTSVLIHVVDVSEGSPLVNYKTVRNELKFYGKDLDKKKEIIVLNKIDLLGKEEMKRVGTLFKSKKPLLISCQTKEGLDRLQESLIRMSKKI